MAEQDMQKFSSEILRHFDEKAVETQRHFDVVAEDMSSKIQLVAESVSGIQEQLISVRDMVAKNTEDIEVIKMDTESIKQMLRRKVDMEEFEMLEKRVGALEGKLRGA